MIHTQLIQQPLSQPIPSHSIQGDPAARRFGLYLLVTLAMVTIGSIVGIAAGNVAHYRYASPVSVSNVSFAIALNQTLQNLISAASQSASSSRKIRHSWLYIEQPVNNRRW